MDGCDPRHPTFLLWREGCRLSTDAHARTDSDADESSNRYPDPNACAHLLAAGYADADEDPERYLDSVGLTDVDSESDADLWPMPDRGEVLPPDVYLHSAFGLQAPRPSRDGRRQRNTRRECRHPAGELK